MMRLGIAILSLWLALAPAFAQVGGLSFPGPGTVHSTGGGATTTLDPANTAATVTLSGGNLVMTEATGAGNSRSVANHSSGKFYCEMTMTTGPNAYDNALAIGNASASLTNGPGSPDTNSASLYNGDTNIYIAGGASGVTVGLSAATNVIGMAVDLGNKRIWYRINGGNWNGSPTNDPASNVGGADITAITTGTMYVLGNVGTVGGAVNTFNFGGSAYANAAPSGFGNW